MGDASGSNHDPQAGRDDQPRANPVLAVPDAELAVAGDRAFRTLFDLSLDAILITTPDEGRILEVNEAACQLFGWNAEELLRRSRADLVDPADPRLEELLAGRSRAGRSKGAVRCVRKDGARFEADVVTFYTVRPGDRQEVSVTVVRDVSVREEAERARRDALSRLEKIAAHVPGVVYQYQLWPDGHSAFPFASRGMQEIYGIDPVVVARDASSVFATLHPDDLERISASIVASAERLTTWHEEYRINLPDGRSIWVEGISSPERQPDGSTLWHGYIRDITERKHAEEELGRYRSRLEHLVEERTRELAEARDEAQSASREKSTFLANMSHEIRTPLNAIIGFTDLMLGGGAGAINDEQKKQLEIVSGASHHLLALISDVLDISKIEAGQLKVDRVPFNVTDLVARAVATMRPAATAKSLSVTAALPPGVGLALGDERRTYQVLINLLSNAVKFTERGGVHVDVRALDHGTVLIEVHDTGVGISREDQARLFQPFRQVGSASTRRQDGVGLGLAISRRLIELQGGQIALQSEPGAGTTFRFTLPTA